MIVSSNNIQQRSFMIDNTLFPEISQGYFGRKILQVNSSPDVSQPSFIALLCIIAVLTVVLVIIIIIFYCRYYAHRERTLRDSNEHPNKFQQISCIENNSQSSVPVSIVPTSASSSPYLVKSCEHLFSNPHGRHPISSMNILPSQHLQQTTIDAYLNDLTLFPSTVMDIKQLNSYLFVDLHSTSSETFPDKFFKQFTSNTITSGYNRSTEDESQRNHRYNHEQQQQRRSTLTLKGSHGPRFLMRERYLSNNIHKLPQLRQATMQQQRYLFGIDDSNNSSTSQTLPSTNISPKKDDYDDSHSYHVHQNRILQTIKEERPAIIPQHYHHYEQEPYFSEMTSTSPDDDSYIQIPYKSSPIMNNRISYMNDSIIV